MEELDRLFGVAQGMSESANDVDSLKQALKAALNALGAVCGELKQLRKDYDELNEYVTRIDEDLSELELMHDEEEEYDKLYSDENAGDEDDESESTDDEDIEELLGKLFQKSDEQSEQDEGKNNPSGLYMWKNDDEDE